MTDTPLFAYGGLLVAGGAMGFAKKGSLMSLLAGGLSGTYFMLAASEMNEAHEVNCKALSGALTVIMSVRAIRSGKIMPSGAVAILSAAVLAYLFNKI
ncbi:Protein FATTY ACID EXPORT 6 [Hondaea fermentalgiana]|uniref:Protein FATTY ACID EXPORT 6 n=1 Tax=Hondaea fermentalgiana TaxID=2315210 RepID=A0A2R5G906_9STRA|nr:Protein FATTY ACID EXPORT 6 [Hondaea fermentalgiana]|eukprot:GBG26258.1 Protein FATTY ACID EXPORT 6 [Hondaea fermentalgiana]